MAETFERRPSALETSEMPSSIVSQYEADMNHRSLASRPHKDAERLVDLSCAGVLFLCLGSASLVGNVAAPLSELAIDLVALGAMTAVGVVLIRSQRTISRREGAVAVGLYVLFLATSIARG